MPGPRRARRSWPEVLRRHPRGLTEELWRFLLVGGAGFVTDVAVFTALRSEALGLLDDHPLTAKVASTAVATAVTWQGNRWWTWGHRTTASTRRELVLFVAMNVVGMGIAVGCLAVSHYVLGFTSLLADNVAANGVGLVLGTAFRFVAYRTVVFRDAPRPPADGGVLVTGGAPDARERGA
ncbi:GtrA family protein [uncultured Pseudokineococcus sp.]|uniref:GtrA family protein n=1 Tax=uncultured Pseudokineococcus sp. TaxID=1642928 RepID=UPI00262DC6B0|nr:GtrA family protein [uncultured Pseudokineococcus sp.]